MKYRIHNKYIEEGTIDIPIGSIILDTEYILESYSTARQNIGSIDRLMKYYYIQQIYSKIDKSELDIDTIKYAIMDGIPKPDTNKKIIQKITYMYPVKGE